MVKCDHPPTTHIRDTLFCSAFGVLYHQIHVQQWCGSSVEEAGLCHWLHAVCHVQHCGRLLLQHLPPGGRHSKFTAVGQKPRTYVWNKIRYPLNIQFLLYWSCEPGPYSTSTLTPSPSSMKKAETSVELTILKTSSVLNRGVQNCSYVPDRG